MEPPDHHDKAEAFNQERGVVDDWEDVSIKYREFPVEDGYVRVPTLYPGLNITAMEPPDLELWTAETAFKAQIVPQLYMFIPSALLGFIIGMTFWIINLVIIRLFSLARKSFNSNVGNGNKTDDLDLQGPGQEDL